MSNVALDALAQAVETVPDPRSKQGVTHPYLCAATAVGSVTGTRLR